MVQKLWSAPKVRNQKSPDGRVKDCEVNTPCLSEVVWTLTPVQEANHPSAVWGNGGECSVAWECKSEAVCRERKIARNWIEHRERKQERVLESPTITPFQNENRRRGKIRKVKYKNEAISKVKIQLQYNFGFDLKVFHRHAPWSHDLLWAIWYSDFKRRNALISADFQVPYQYFD